MKGTKLWSAAGSPLIQGRSRRERPFASDWLTAWIVGGLLGGAVVVGVMVYKDSGLVTALRTVWLPVIPSAALGSALGVWLASAFGWHPRWAAGSVTAAIASFLGTFGFTVFLLSRLGG